VNLARGVVVGRHRNLRCLVILGLARACRVLPASCYLLSTCGAECNAQLPQLVPGPERRLCLIFPAAVITTRRSASATCRSPHSSDAKAEDATHSSPSAPLPVASGYARLVGVQPCLFRSFCRTTRGGSPASPAAPRAVG